MCSVTLQLKHCKQIKQRHHSYVKLLYLLNWCRVGNLKKRIILLIFISSPSPGINNYLKSIRLSHFGVFQFFKILFIHLALKSIKDINFVEKLVGSSINF